MEFWKTLKKKDYNTSSGNPLYDLAAFGLRPLGKEHGLIKELTSSLQVVLYHWLAFIVSPHLRWKEPK